MLSKNILLLVTIFVLCITASGMAQQQEVSGIVIDRTTGELLPGVNIVIQGTTQGTTTNEDGFYSIAVPSLDETLVFSFIGYQSQEIPIDGQTELDVELLATEIIGDELIVIGYGRQRQRDLTGSISTIRATDFENVSVDSPEKLLQGRVTGVQLINNSGQPGSATTVQIRGGTSITAGNLPLFVVDGIPIDASTEESTVGVNHGAPINPLSSINPDDIESISILKDASATAIYGARGAAGVVLITTKSGVGGQPRVNFSTSYGVEEVQNRISLLNAEQFARIANEALINDGQAPRYTESEISAMGDGTDWPSQIFRTGSRQKHSLSISGGDVNTQYYISGAYGFHDGVIVGSDLEDLNLRVNLNAELSNSFRVGNNFNIGTVNSNIIRSSVPTRGSVSDVVTGAHFFNPTQSIFNPDGSYVLISDPGQQSNPVAQVREITNQNEMNRYMNNFFAELDISDNLTVRSDIGINSLNSDEYFFRPDIIQIVSIQSVADIGSLKSTNWVNNNIVRYETAFERFGTPQELELMGGFTLEGGEREVVGASSRGFPVNDLKHFNLGAAEEILTARSNHESWNLVSYIGRANYRINDTYLVTASARVDGSSRFGEGNKYGFFPSGAIAWNLSNEEFIRQMNIFNDLKLRVSYGITGHQAIRNFQSLSLLGTTNVGLGEQVQKAIFPQNIGNPDLKWETTSQFNIGTDIEILNGALSFSADFYNKRTKDLLLNMPLPNTTGFDNTLVNLGELKNAGFEFGIRANSISVGQAFFNFGFNISFNENEVLDLGGLEPFLVGDTQESAIGNVNIIQEGKPLGTFYGLIYDGIFQNEQEIANSAQPNALPGDERFVDMNGDGQINADDRTFIGSAQPDFTGGISSSLLYRNFELAVNLNFVYGNKIFNQLKSNLELPTGEKNMSTAVLDRWTPENPTGTIQRASTAARIDFSDRHLEDGSYLRLQNIILAYNLPVDLLTRVRVRNLKIFARGENLLVITNYSGFDPDISLQGQNTLAQGQDLGVYPTSRSIAAGFEIGF